MYKLIILVAVAIFLWGCGDNTVKSESTADDEEDAVEFTSPLDPDKPRTIVLICEDALRRDMLPIYGNEVIRTPNLDRITENAVVFDNAYSPSSWTKPAFSSIFTGLPSSNTHSTRHESIMRDDCSTLAELLDSDGWNTCIITANPYTGKDFGVARGFETQVSLWKPKEVEKTYAEDFIPPTEQWLDTLTADEDAFIVLHMMDTHTPYHPPSSFCDRYSADKEQLLITTTPWLMKSGVLSGMPIPIDKAISELVQYCNSITYFDEVLPEIQKLFRNHGRDDNALYIFFADHGEEMLDHGGIKHGHTLYQELIRVPLMVWGSGLKPVRSGQHVNLIDMMPTILDLAEIEIPQGLEGESFATYLRGNSTQKKKAQFAETEQNPPNMISVVDGKWKLILSGSQYQLFDLDADPHELNNIAEENQLRLCFERSKLKCWWKSSHIDTNRDILNADLDDETIEALKGLGYIQ